MIRFQHFSLHDDKSSTLKGVAVKISKWYGEENWLKFIFMPLQFEVTVVSSILFARRVLCVREHSETQMHKSGAQFKLVSLYVKVEEWTEERA